SQLPVKTFALPRARTISQSTIAPETIRIDVKLTASMPVFFNAIRQSSELAAKAIMASVASNAMRAGNLILELLMPEYAIRFPW
ncbi:MAG: hypothetical protein WCC48_06855, partial [Anaeromyxobacteraceae bacterium]